jgi:hypothetical protein
MTSKEAADLLQGLICASQACLDLLKIPHEPGPYQKRSGRWVERTRPWRTPGGPEGIAYHYTGGLNGVKSLRWFNDSRWRNRSSSAAVLVFDRLIPALASTWRRHDVSAIFRVPTIILADISKSTWTTNWANNRCLGVENRNAGTRFYDEAALGKPRVFRAGHFWEPYTREQLEANILLGRMFRALRGDHVFKPEWVVGHSQIWATKRDPGPCFPLFPIRDAIWSETPLDELLWLEPYPRALAEVDDLDGPEERPDDAFRGDPELIEPSWDALDTGGFGDRAAWVAETLARLGWHLPAGTTERGLRKFVSYYQRSTLAHKRDNPGRVLSVDGLAGPATCGSMKARLIELGA